MGNLLREKINEGKNLLGTWSMLSSSNVVDVLGTTDLDFYIADLEHGSMSYQTIEDMVRAGESRGISSIVRTQNCDESTILRSLETGCEGIMIPHVENLETAQRVAKACRYFPRGDRGLSPYTRTHNFCHETLVETSQKANEVVVGILVEGKEGLANLDAISKVEEIDLVYLGVYDLSQAMGVPGELDHPKVIEEIKRSVEIISRNGKTAGTFVRDIKSAKDYRSYGFKFLAYLVDSYAMKNFFDNVIEEINA